MSRKREAVEAKLARGRTSPAHLERLRAFNVAQTDWRGRCRHCGTTSTGSIQQLSRPCSNCGYGGSDGHVHT
jgi:ribosomal protein L37E